MFWKTIYFLGWIVWAIGIYYGIALIFPESGFPLFANDPQPFEPGQQFLATLFFFPMIGALAVLLALYTPVAFYREENR